MHVKNPQIPPAGALVEGIADRLLARGQWLAVAESCTGGLIARLLTDLPGSSAWFERGIVSYSNRAKQDLLGVPGALLERHGAVSGEVAQAMAGGLLARAPVDWALAVTGVAGPGGGSPDKPVGIVWIAWGERARFASTARGGLGEFARSEFARQPRTTVRGSAQGCVEQGPAMDGRAGAGEERRGLATDGNAEPYVTPKRFQFQGDRESIRTQAAQTALQGLLERLGRV